MWCVAYSSHTILPLVKSRHNCYHPKYGNYLLISCSISPACAAHPTSERMLGWLNSLSCARGKTSQLNHSADKVQDREKSVTQREKSVCVFSVHCSRRVLLMGHTSSILSTEACLFHCFDLVLTPYNSAFRPTWWCTRQNLIHGVVPCPEIF